MVNRKSTILIAVLVLMALVSLAYASSVSVKVWGDSLIFRDGNGNEHKLQGVDPITAKTVNVANLVSTDDTQTLTNKTLTSPVINGTVSGGATYTAPTLTSPVINTPTINDGTDAQAYVANVSGVMVPVAMTFTGDLSGTMPNTGIWNGQMVANSVTNTELDNTDDFVVNSLTVTGDLILEGDFDPYAEMFGAAVTVTLGAGAFDNVIGLTNGIASAGMIQNSTDGSITVEKAGVYKPIASMSMSDPDSNSEDYCFTFGVDGSEQIKCIGHRDIRVQTAHGMGPVSCLLDLSAGAVVTLMGNSAGGDDLHFDRVNWFITK